MYHGRRDEDEETRSYVQTYALFLVGMPLLSLAAYRLAVFDHGVEVVGRVVLSQEERAANVVAVCRFLLVGLVLHAVFGMWALSRARDRAVPDLDPLGIIGRPDEFARRKLKEAEDLAAAGKPAEAARVCREVAQGGGTPEQSAAAAGRVGTLLEHPAAQGSGAEQAGVLRVAVALEQAGRWSEPSEALYRRGMGLVERRVSTDPTGALEVLEAVAPLAPGRGEDLNAMRQGLLETLVADRPDDPGSISRLAAVHEARGQDDRAVALLEPLRSRLGTAEGARILGLGDVRRGRVEPALTLLRPYAHAHLGALHAAEAALDSAHRTAPERHRDKMLATPIPNASSLPREERMRRLSKYFEDLYAGDTQIEEARRRRHDETSVVPVALEVGTILLKHAQGLTDRKARESELAEAETLFLEVVRLTGEGKLALELAVPAGQEEAEQHRLELAEVRYWQGNPRDGRALIDQALEARKRDPGMLWRVSRLLRRVGSLDEARALSEEAYASGRAPAIRGKAAVHRGLLGLDLDDKIAWLRKAEKDDPEARVFLATYLGDQALERGEEDQAVSRYREALTLYDAVPEAPWMLNNSALILFTLAGLTGDRAAYDRGRARIEKSHRLDPVNSLTMRSLAPYVRVDALGEIIGAAIDFRLLETSAELEHLGFLHHDHAGREGYVRSVRAHAGIDRLISLLERTLLLSPRDGFLYKALNDLYAYRGETEKQRGLLQRLERVELDQSDEIARARALYAGDREEQRRAAAAGAILRAEAVLKAARARRRDATFAIAAAGLANARMRGHHAGLAADADAVVSLAEEAHAAAPSYRTRNVLTNALLFRAGRQLASTQPGYARMAEKTHRSTTDSDLVGDALNGDEPLRGAARQDPDIRRAVDVILSAYRDDPEHEASPWAWCLVRAFDPREGDRIARTYLKNESAQLSRQVRSKLEPTSASAALSLYWAAEMVGPDAGGHDILRAYAARGVPLPIE